MEKLKRVLIWILLNAVVGVPVFAGVFTKYADDPGVVRFAVFAMWATSVVAWLLFPLVFLCVALAPASFKEPVRTVPAWVSFVFDLAVVAAAVYAGWIWTGAFYFSHMCAQYFTIGLIESSISQRSKANP